MNLLKNLRSLMLGALIALPLMASAYTVRVPIQGLGPAASDPYFGDVVALLHFDGSLADQTGAAYAKSAGAVVSSTAKVGSGSLYLPGADYIQASNSELNFGTGDFTVEFWYYMKTAGGSYMYLTNNVGAANGNLFVIRFGDGGYGNNLQFIIGTDPNNIVSPGLTKSNFVGGWHHLAITRQGTTLRTYFDGTLKTTSTNSANVTGANFKLGDTTYPAYGYFDEVRITKGYARYTSTSFTPNTTPFPNQ